MPAPQRRPKPPLLALLTALFFAAVLFAFGLSISVEAFAVLFWISFVAWIVTWIWVTSGQDVVKRAALVLSIAFMLVVGRIGWIFLSENWFVLVPVVAGCAAFSYLILRLFLGSLVELLWAFSLPARVEAPQLEVWRVLLFSRVSLTSGLIWRSLTEKLQIDQSAEAANLLVATVIGHPDPAARPFALQALGRFTSTAAIDTICIIWTQTRHTDLTKLLIEKRWKATETAPVDVVVLSRLLLGEVEPLRQTKADLIPALARACGDKDQEIAERACQVLRGLEKTEAQDALCRLVIEQENQPACDIALAAGYLPRNEQQRALFLFITEQWERYTAHDFDRRLMHLAYLTSPEPLRQRIREKLRRIGRIDFLPIIAGENLAERAAQFTVGESEVLTQTLIANRDWAALWPRVFELPFRWSVRAVAALAENDWKPANSEDQALLTELSSMVAGGLLMEPGEERELFPLGIMQATARVPGRINAVAFAPSHPTIAVGTGQGKVVLWNYQTAQRERVLRSFQHSIGEVTFSPQGILFCAERTNGSAPCSIHAFQDAWQSETSHVLGIHAGSVTALVPVGSSQLLSAGNDGNLVLWDAATCKEINRRRVVDWARSLRISPDGSQILLLRRGFDLLSFPELQERARIGRNAVFRCAAFAPDGQTIFAGTFSGKLFIYRPASQRSDVLVCAKKPLTEYPPSERVEAAEVLNRLSIVVSVGTGGEIRFFSLDGHQLLGKLNVPGGQITSLNVSPDEAFLAVGSAEATLSFWDLRTIDMRLLLERPFAQAEVTIIPSLNTLLGHANLSARAQLALRFAQTVLQHRFRFTIELGDAPSIALGEFDIEIDG